MSVTKEALERAEWYYKIVFDELVRMGAIKTCDIHNDWFETCRTDNYVYGVVTNRAKRILGDGLDSKLLHQQIKEILDQGMMSQDGCPFCAKIENE